VFAGTRDNVVQIKKYPNRRYYDATNSRHITLQEVHDMIVAGQDVCVTDSRTGDDITNLVLTQILLERDEPKLDLFPSSVLHLIIRSNRQVLRTWLERSFGPFMGVLSTSQKQMDAYWRQAMQGNLVSPMDWASRFMQAFSGEPPHATSTADAPPADAPPPEVPAESLDELRTRLEQLQRQVADLSATRKPA
jgi:polyhydroxyalkanoate synthesis repressor PhaR